MDWCVRSLHAIQDIANKRRRNYILDQVNPYERIIYVLVYKKIKAIQVHTILRTAKTNKNAPAPIVDKSRV